MKEYQLFVGLDDQHEKRQIIETEKAVSIIAQALLDAGIEGATFTQGKGLYRYQNGNIGFENSVIVSILDFDGNAESAIRQTIPSIKSALNQESVALKSYDVESVLL